MESGHFLPQLAGYWECIESYYSLWIELIAVFVSSYGEEYLFFFHFNVAAKHKETTSAELLQTLM